MSKTETINCLRLRIWWLMPRVKAARGYLSTLVSWDESHSIRVEVSLFDREPYARLIYQFKNKMPGEKTDFDYKMPLVTTRCHFGGSRYWFRCSLVKNGVPCNRRVGVLYMDGDYFGCRHCHNLAYKSQNESRRGIFSQFFGSYDIQDKAEQLEKEAKRFTYRGKPTKKQRKIEALYERSNRSFLASLGREVERRLRKNEL